MAVLIRLNDFVPNTLIQSAQVDAEFQQLVDILSGVSTTKEALITLSHAATPPLTLNQTGAGLIQSWKLSGVEVARVNNAGDFTVAGLTVLGTSPQIFLTDTNGEDFQLTLNADTLTFTMGGVTHIELRGGANDDVVFSRLATFNANLNIGGTTPTFSMLDSDGEDFSIGVDGDIADFNMGGVNHIRLRGGANDDTQFVRPITNIPPSAAGLGISVDHTSANSSGTFFRGRTGGTQRIAILPFDLGGARVGGWIDMSTTGPSGLGSGGVGAAAWIAYADTNGAYFTDALTGDIAYRSVDNTKRLIFGNDGGAAAALFVTGNAVGVNRGTSLGASLHAQARTTGTIGLVVNNPSSTTVDIAQFHTNDVAVLQIKNNGQIKGIPKCIHTNGTATGNVGAGLDTLHSFSLPAGSLAANGDYVKARYAGTFSTDDDNKRIVISFGGQTVHDPGSFDQDSGSWSYDIVYLRLTDTTVMFSLLGAWNAIVVDDGTPAATDGIFLALGTVLTVADLDVNAMTMLVQAEGVNNDNIVQRMSIIELTQNS